MPTRYSTTDRVHPRIARRVAGPAGPANQQFLKEKSQDDGWKITTEYGHIEYRPIEDYGERINEIWWVESEMPGSGSKLVDFMMEENPANAVAWGATSQSGKALMKKWHFHNPGIQCITGTHEGQIDPFGNKGDEPEEPEED